MSEKNNSAKSYAKYRLFRKIGLITVGITLPALVLVTVVSLLPRNSSGSGNSENEHFLMQMDENDRPIEINMYDDLATKVKKDSIVGTKISKAWTVDTLQVTDHIDSLSLRELAGDNNLHEYDQKGNITNDLALVQTVFLQNTGGESQHFKFNVTMDDYIGPQSYEPQTYEYLRIGVMTSEVESIDDPTDVNKQAKFYANKYTPGLLTLPSGKVITKPDYPNYDESTGNREPIAAYEYVDENRNGEITRYTKPTESYLGIEYCTNFLNRNDGVFVEDDISVDVNKILRFTFFAYLEGNDRDCNGSAPSGVKLNFSVRFGRS